MRTRADAGTSGSLDILILESMNAMPVYGMVGLLNVLSLALLPTSIASPPEPTSLLLGNLPLAHLQRLQQYCAPLILLFPVFRPVYIPIFSETWRERLGQEEKFDMIPTRGKILFITGPVIIFVYVGQRMMPAGALILLRFHQQGLLHEFV